MHRLKTSIHRAEDLPSLKQVLKQGERSTFLGSTPELIQVEVGISSPL